MDRLLATSRRLGTPWLTVAVVGLLIAAMGSFMADRSRLLESCESEEGVSDSPVRSLQGIDSLQAQDSILIRLGASAGASRSIAGVELPRGVRDLDPGASLLAEPGLFTRRDDRSRRIAPEAFTARARVVSSQIVVDLCARPAGLQPGVYEGSVVIADAILVDAELRYQGWLVLIGLPFSVLPALVALAAIDDGRHTRLQFLVALAGAAFFWATYSQGNGINSVSELGQMAAAEFAGASGFLIGLKTLWRAAPIESQEH